MQIDNDNWYNAIFQRRSRRQFDGQVLPNDLFESLVQFSQELNDRLEGAKVIVVNEKPDHVFKGAIGSYGKIKGATTYVAFVGDMSDAMVQEKVGYLGEFFILEAVSRGLATCWIGGFFKPEAVKRHIKLTKQEQVLAVSPLGFAEEQLSLEEKIMGGIAASHKRKSLDTLCSSVPFDSLPQWMRSSLEAARLAPSAVNRQPWRFSVENGTLKISVDSAKDSYHISKRLDCGIAMAHLEIGARHEEVTGKWEPLKGLDVAQFKPI